LLGRTETQALVAHVARRAPQLIQDVIPQMIGIALLQKILQSLLEEGVHVRDMRSIVESLAEQSAVGVTEPGEMVRRLRRTVPRLKVLAFSEIPDTHSIRIGSIIGAQS
jgi:flagellar biosynthesis protein FlhA